jgi:hypothetical protein
MALLQLMQLLPTPKNHIALSGPLRRIACLGAELDIPKSSVLLGERYLSLKYCCVLLKKRRPP